MPSLNSIQEVLRFASRGSPSTMAEARSLIRDAGLDAGLGEAAEECFNLAVRELYPGEREVTIIPLDDMEAVFKRAIEHCDSKSSGEPDFAAQKE